VLANQELRGRIALVIYALLDIGALDAMHPFGLDDIGDGFNHRATITATSFWEFFALLKNYGDYLLLI
jgi:hypothetical protein